MSAGSRLLQSSRPARAARAEAARRRLGSGAAAPVLPDSLFAAAALGRVQGVSAVIRSATAFEALTFEGIEADSVRVSLRQGLRAVSPHEAALPTERWFPAERWRWLLVTAPLERTI